MDEPPQNEPTPVASPCTKVCVLDRDTGYCFGCGRTGDEIAAWPTMSEAERADLVQRLPARLPPQQQ